MADPEELAQEISHARARLIDFAKSCSDEQWLSSPLGPADPRPVGVIVDHVADAYGYLASWIEDLAAGETVSVDSDVVDGLNARHASETAVWGRSDVNRHLVQRGEEIIELVRRLTVDQLSLGDGRVEMLARIAARHADSHRSELEEVFAIPDGG